jgi:hydroxymethylglutaryl-CoA lyase
MLERSSEPITLREVSLRDGLQILARTVPTAHKLAWLQAAHAAGLREIEVGSFVPPGRLPQLADTAELVQAALSLPGLKVSVLVPNLKGAQAALASGAHQMLLPLSASHAHSLANLRKTPDEVLQDIARIRDLRDAQASGTPGTGCVIEVGISTAFGCTLQGPVPENEVLRLVDASLKAGAEQIGLADTVGYADPLQVQRLFTQAHQQVGQRLSCAHFHDTRGLGLANVYAAWMAGIRRFDACIGGLGGCPHAPGASGNVATEDLAYLFASMGQPTGLAFDALLRLRERVVHWLEGEALHGSIARAGLPKTLLAA